MIDRNSSSRLFALILLSISGAFFIAAAEAQSAPRKLLIFSRCEGFYHDVIPTANRAFQEMGKESGAFEAVVSDDMTMFDPENLNRFDAVLLNNTTGLKFADLGQRQALLDFVRGGKGLIGIHASTDNFYEWPEGAELMGGLFDGHPWGAGGTWAVKIDEPDHPLTAAFEGKPFTIKDEIYQFKAPYSRERLRVLLRLDLSDENNRSAQGIKREDNDFAISWVRPYGKGRVFYCSLGHNPEVFSNQAVLRHYLAGIRYALGDLKVEDAPIPVKTSLADPYREILKYELDDRGEAMVAIENGIWKASKRARKLIEQKLLAALESSASTYTCKQFVCRMLRLIGTDRAAPARAILLPDPTCSHMARFALQQMQTPEADRVLREALGQVQGDLKIGVIGSIAARGDREAVKALGDLLGDSDPKIVEAALAALGRIGDVKAAQILSKANVSGEWIEKKADAQLRCAERLLAEGRTSAADNIYRTLSGEGNSMKVRAAGYIGLAKTRKSEALPLILALFRTNHIELQRAAGSIAAELQDRKASRILTSELPTLSPEAQVLLISALQERGDPSAAKAIENLQSGDEAVRLAMVRALGDLGGASSVPLLARASVEESAVGKEAGESLERLDDPKAVDAMIQLVKAGDSAVRVSLIETLAARRETASLPALLQAARDANEEVRAAADKALGQLAADREWPAMIALLIDRDASEGRRSLEKALESVAGRVEKSDRNAECVIEGIGRANEKAKMVLLGLLPQIGGSRALAAVQDQLAGGSEHVKAAALRAMAAWPDVSPLESLKREAVNNPEKKLRIAALRGCLSLIALPSERSATDTIELLSEAMDLADRPEEKASILAMLPDYVCSAAVDLAESCLSSDAVKQEAEIAIRKIKAEQVSARPEESVDLDAIEVDDGTFEITDAPDGSRCWAFSNYLYFAVQEYFCKRLEGKVRLEWTVLDEGEGIIQLQYDSMDSSAPENGAYKIAGPAVQLGNSGQWRTMTALLEDARFSKRENEGTDFRFQVSGGKGYIKAVRLIRIQ